MSKAKKYFDSIRESRNAWAGMFDRCMGCQGGGDWRGLQIHEICRRSHARNRWANASSYLLLCAACHEGVFASAPHAFQLAIKALRDPEHYSLDDWLSIGDPDGRAPNRVTKEEIDGWKRILASRFN